MCLATIEPRELSAIDNRRPDILVVLDNTRFLIDVSILHPTSITHLRLPSPIAAREKTKRDKYAAMTQQHGMTFVAFVVDTFGGLGQEALDFYDTLSNSIASHIGPWSHYHIVAGLRDAIAIAVQDDTENIIQAAWHRTSSQMRRYIR